MDLAAVQRAYQRYARHYDRIFGPVFDAGRRQTVRYVARRARRRILEVGVGTGLSLPYYPEGCRVVGVDVCPDMLAIARRRAAKHRLTTVEALLHMDAENLDLPDASFDAVVAMYVATVVPNPGRLLSEMARVCVPGGDIVVVSHFASERGLLRFAESTLAPFSKLLGFRTALALDAVPEPSNVRRVAVEPVNALGMWKVVRYRRVASAANGEISKPAANGAAVGDAVPSARV